MGSHVDRNQIAIRSNIVFIVCSQSDRNQIRIKAQQASCITVEAGFRRGGEIDRAPKARMRVSSRGSPELIMSCAELAGSGGADHGRNQTVIRASERFAFE